jgi:uncharacterized membrane protein YfcA
VISGLGLAPGATAIAAVVVLLGGFVRGYSGFGFSAILMAGLGLVLPPADIVPLAIALEVLASLGQARQVWRDIDWRLLAVLLAAGLIGNPLGVLLLTAIPGETLRVAIYLFIGAASLTLLVSPKLGRPLSLPVLAAAGLVAGVVNGAAALSGLTLALVFAVSGISPQIMRATLIAYFFATDLWAGLFLGAAGLFDAAALWRIALSLPLLAFGLWAGNRRFLGSPPASFRKLTLCLLIALSALGLLRALVP